MPNPYDEFTELEKAEGQGQENVIKSLSELSDKIDNSASAQAQAQTLLNDPEVQKILRARQEGRQLTIEEKREVDPMDELMKNLKPKDQAPQFDYEDHTPQELELHILNKVQESVGLSLQPVLQKLSDQMSTINGRFQQQTQTSAQVAINAAKKKYGAEEFAKYEQKMIEISKRNPGLDIDELYLLANPNSGKSTTREQDLEFNETDSEKPSHTSAKRGSKEIKMAPGAKGFEAGLAEALEGIGDKK